MAPDANYEEVERLNAEDYEPGVHQGRRILPELTAPAQAWIENEDLDRSDSVHNSPGENRRLLSPQVHQPVPKHKSRLQAGLTLGVSNTPKRHAKCPQTPKCVKKQKTKYQKRREKLLAILKPPYFIVSMIFFIVCIHIWLPEDARAYLWWTPGAWWREPWRLLTYGFVHANAVHLALNAVVALAVGWCLEREQGWWRVVCVWGGGVAAGALGAGALQPRVQVVGASAAVYALLTAHLPNVCLRFGHIPLWWFRPLSVVVLGASEACWAAAHAPPVPARDDHVAWSAHVLGAVVGVPVAFIVFHGENDSTLFIKVCRVLSALVLTAGIIAAALHFTLWHDVDY
ncbi:rhomboid-related protein 1-like [Ostrinia nubilalis]|uniref:rhomboid-related protein 1-like n=1 Tax=Ostrinia nubilalis TaxID=29057 RepID=UPI0030823576